MSDSKRERGRVGKKEWTDFFERLKAQLPRPEDLTPMTPRKTERGNKVNPFIEAWGGPQYADAYADALADGASHFEYEDGGLVFRREISQSERDIYDCWTDGEKGTDDE